jgi:glycerol-3-phosphate O-acyltransferase
MINKGLGYLKDFIDSKRDILEPLVSAKQGEKSILMLAYYRNNLTHVFINEAEIACTLLVFSNLKEASGGLSLDDAWKRTQFLKSLLNEEFVLRDTMKTPEEFRAII